jgi:hypothetical protein
MWITGGTNNLSGTAVITLGYSYDGINWMYVPNSNITFSTNVRGIAWSPVLNMWVAVGKGTHQLAYSYDGLTWIGVPSVTFGAAGFVQGYCVVWGEDKFIACGGNTGTTTTGTKLYYSFNGIHWIAITSTSPLSVGVYGIGYNGTMYVCVGNNNTSTAAAYSYDGITWTTTPTVSIFANSLNTAGSVAWSGDRWVIGGSYSNTVNIVGAYYSFDGINWLPTINTSGGGQ